MLDQRGLIFIIYLIAFFLLVNRIIEVIHVFILICCDSSSVVKILIIFAKPFWSLETI
jgi:hypothetical protein